MSVEISRAHRSAAAYRYMREQLLVADPTLIEDEEALLDTLEGCTDLDSALATLLRSAKLDEHQAGGISEALRMAAERKGRLERRAVAKRKIALNIMADNGIKKITAPDLTITRREVGQSVVIIDEAKIPDELMRIKREPNKTAIKQALVNGENVPGAELSNGGETLLIRTT